MLVAILLVGTALASLEAWAIEGQSHIAPSSSDFGGAGLIQMPSARHFDQGEFRISGGDIFPYTRYSVTLQVLPWLSGTFRYTRTNNRPFNSRFIDEPQTDKGLDIAVRLVKENRYLPDVTVGFRDVGGNQQFSTEYIAASKRYYNMDFTVGMAWGNAGSRGHFRNPLGYLATRFDSREAFVGQTGQLSTSFFHGKDVALFGGVEYNTPLEGLRLKVEYDGNDYQTELDGNAFEVDSPFNFGAEYELTSWLTLRGSLQRGNEGYFGAVIDTNFNEFTGPTKTDLKSPAIKPRRALTPEEKARRTMLRQPNAELVQTALAAAPIVPSPPAPLPMPPRQATVLDPLYIHLAERGLDVSDIWIEDGRAVVEFTPIAVPSHEDVASAALIVARHPGFRGVREVVLAVSGDTYAVESLQVADLERSMEYTGSSGAMTAALSPSWWKAVSSSGASNIAASDIATLYDLLEQMRLPTDDVIVEGDTLIVPFSGADKLDVATRATISDVLDTSLKNVGLQRVVIQEPSETQHGFWEEIAAMTLGSRAVREVGQQELDAVSTDLFRELSKNRITGIELTLHGNTAILAYSQSRYKNATLIIGRAARIMSRHMPDHIEQFRLIARESSLDVSDVTIIRSKLEQADRGGVNPEELLVEALIRSPSAEPVPEGPSVRNPRAYPAFQWSLAPDLRQHVGGGDEFFASQLYARASATLRPVEGVILSGAVAHNLWNNFDQLVDQAVDGPLPRVRSDVVKYLQGSDTWLDDLTASYVAEIGPDLYARASVGYFEMMYAGYGGEVLYRPTGKRWAVGFDWNIVRQRDFEGGFGLLDAKRSTGHATLYYDVPWENVNLQLKAGRYLAGDVGGTMILSKEFDNGTTAGVWATLTDVPFDVFGEGSFDKGGFITIPLDIFVREPTRRRFTFPFSLLTKDGGQRVGVPDRLYGITGRKEHRVPTLNWDTILD